MRLRAVGAVVAGLLVAVSLPPWGIWPAAFAGLALLVVTLTDASWWQRGLLGLGAGTVWFGTTLWWVSSFTGPGAVALVVLQAVFPAAAAVVTPPGRGRCLAFPGAFVLAETVRQRWPLGGLPLSDVALGQVDGPLRLLAALVGPLGLLLATAAVASLFGASFGVRRRPVAAAAMVVAALAAVLFPLLLPVALGTHAGGPPIEVAAVQGGGPRGVAAVDAPSGERQRVFQRHLVASRSATADVQIVLWPEDTVDVVGQFAGSDEHEAIARLAADLLAYVVVGVIEDVEGARTEVRRFRNAAVVVGPDGVIVGRHDKVLRVPFGEYVPWRSVLDRFADLSLIPRDAVSGDGVGLVTTPIANLGVAISFEGLFGRRTRDAVRSGADLILLPTNSSSYVSKDVPAQQLAAARLRAIETGRAVVMAAPTGYSAVVDPDGRVRHRSELGESALLSAAVQPRRGLTPYARHGDGPAVLLALAVVAAAWASAGRSETNTYDETVVS